MSTPQDRRSLLHPQGSDQSDSPGAVTSPPITTARQRHGYTRKTTNDELIPSLSEAHQEDIALDYPDTLQRSNPGLGITAVDRPISITRKPVGASSSPQTPNAEHPFQSLPDTSPGPKSFPNSPEIVTLGSSRPFLLPAWNTQKSEGYSCGFGGEEDLSLPESTTGRTGHTRVVSFLDEHAEAHLVEDDTTQLKPAISSTFYKAPLDGDCATKHDIESGRGSWLSITFLILSFYSTSMSMLWLVTACVQPRWGRFISSGGAISPSTASLLTALFAKTIELSFVTVFVGFLGQALSRRSIARFSKGITIAEMSMRTWVIQPSSMLTHWQTLRYAGWTFLGVLSFVAALGAILYTTASDALVSPKLKYSDWTNMQMQGQVRTSYANPIFISDNCQTPITAAEDGDNAGSTCVTIQNAGQSFYNFLSWMQIWASISENGTGESTYILNRPQAVAMLYDNTTVQGSWVKADSSDVPANFAKFSRIVNNVTMSMPHAGVYAAARDPKNSIMQPIELDGVGGYSIRASVVSPAVNVLCVNMAPGELEPLVYTYWPNAKFTNNTQSQGQRIPLDAVGWINDIPTAGSNETWLNSTVVDEIFGWGEKYRRRPPVFEMFPMDNNIIMNKSMYQGDSAYFIVKSFSISNYTLCSLRSFLNPNCSTQHNVSGTSGGGSLISHCEDPDDEEAYALSVPNSPISLSTDWVNCVNTWALAISLNGGSVNANASIARLLSQLVLVTENLPTLTPSLAEAVAVLVGNTLLTGTTQAAFVHYWQYKGSVLTPGDYQTFNASVATQQYTSGYTQSWQATFYPVLVIVVLINVFCFGYFGYYFFRHSGPLTDFTEPQNLFALAINSPPSKSIGGSCGAGPEGGQFQTDWFVKHDNETNHYYIQEGVRWKMKSKTSGYKLSPNSHDARESSYSRLSNSRGLL